MKNFIFVIVLILSFQLGQSQFMRMPLNYTHDSTLHSPNVISIVDQDHIWIATQRLDPSTSYYLPYSEALTTTDRGNTWHFYHIPANGNPLLLDVEAYSDSICYYFVDDFYTGHSDIWKTVNAGSSWSKKTTSQFPSFGDFIHLFSKDTLIAVGDPPDGYLNIQITTDGGETWTRVPQSNIPAILTGETPYSGNKSFSAIGNTIWFTTSLGRCFKSTDKGYDWTVSNVDTSFGYQGSYVCFSDLQHGIFYCYGMTFPIRFYRTFDGGETWTNFPILQNLYAPVISSVGGIFEGFVIAAGDTIFPIRTYIYYTTDFFNTLTILDTVELTSNFIYFKDAYTGWLAGLFLPDSAIFKFTDVLTSIKIKPIVQGNIIITPNPTCQSSLLTFPSEFLSERKILRVFAVSGKLMKEYTLTANVKSIELNSAEYLNGVYIIELISNTGLNKITRWVVIH